MGQGLQSPSPKNLEDRRTVVRFTTVTPFLWPLVGICIANLAVSDFLPTYAIYAMPPVAIDLEETVDIFNRDEWIGRGRKFDSVPFHVISAYTQAVGMPEAIPLDFPDPDLPITEFIQLSLPKQPSSISTTQAHLWLPKDDVTKMGTRTIPPNDVL
jgi:hypothetical protein